MPSVNPLLRIRCPYCREKFHPGDCSIYSTINPGVELRKAPEKGSFEYARSRVWIDELVGPEFVSEKARRQCPKCFKLLFEGIETCDNLNIAIVGDVGSGKTHYIALLIDQLKRGVFMQYGNSSMRLMHLNEQTEQTYRNDYYKPIIQERRGDLAGTEPGHFDIDGTTPMRREPLVYQLTINDAAHPCHINLLIYDLAGEDIATGTRLVQFGEHILRADGIIYLADPMSMPTIYQQLPSEIRPDADDLTGRASEEVLQTLSFHLEQYNKTGIGGHTRVPTAIVISKFDLFQYIIPPQVRRNLVLLQQPAYDGKAHVAELSRVDMEVRYCLQVCNETRLERESQTFTEAAFFAISATGTHPDQYGKYASVTPHRCLDPFIWILWKLGYIAGR